MGSAGRADKFFFRRDGKGRWDLMTVWAAVHRKTGKKETQTTKKLRSCPKGTAHARNTGTLVHGKGSRNVKDFITSALGEKLMRRLVYVDRESR